MFSILNLKFESLKGTPESRELKKKGETISAVLLSEADYLDQIRIPDFSRSIKAYLAQRAEFHRKQMELFEAAASQFPDFEWFFPENSDFKPVVGMLTCWSSFWILI